MRREPPVLLGPRLPGRRVRPRQRVGQHWQLHQQRPGVWREPSLLLGQLLPGERLRGGQRAALVPTAQAAEGWVAPRLVPPPGAHRTVLLRKLSLQGIAALPGPGSYNPRMLL